MDSDGFEVPADAARLEVDARAGAHVERQARGGEVGDGLIQTHRRLQPGLEPGVAGEVVFVERLLDQHQPEVVERLERGCVVGIV